jgi:NAD(P)-dependent dehydrogenase (short-subunit alcohol dehydrogenase family)
MLLENRVAIVTGGAMGIGRGIAMKFANEGCKVAISDIKMKEANDTIAEMVRRGGEGMAVECNATNGKQVKNLVDQVIKKYGKIDILVNNAGMDPGWVKFIDMDLNDIRKAMEVNLYGGMNMVKAIAPHMISRKQGRIVNFSGGQGGPNTTSYSASKGAVDSWSDVLAKELVPLGVIVNTFLPPPAKTRLGEGSLPPNFAEAVAKMMPLGRLTRPDEVGSIIAYMVSETNSYMIGQYIKL